jgi:hypothetical protein
MCPRVLSSPVRVANVCVTGFITQRVQYTENTTDQRHAQGEAECCCFTSAQHVHNCKAPKKLHASKYIAATSTAVTPCLLFARSPTSANLPTSSHHQSSNQCLVCSTPLEGAALHRDNYKEHCGHARSAGQGHHTSIVVMCSYHCNGSL